MKTQIWISILLILLLAAVSAAGALAAGEAGVQEAQAEMDASTISLAKSGLLAQVYTGGVVLLMLLMAVYPLVFGCEPGAGINIQ